MKINSFLLRCTLIAALGGFLFGFETAVISGAEKTIQQLWSLSDFLSGIYCSRQPDRNGDRIHDCRQSGTTLWTEKSAAGHCTDVPVVGSGLFTHANLDISLLFSV